MIKKIINKVLILILFLLPLVIFPPKFSPDNYNIPKIVLLYGCGITLLICLCINYKNFKLDKFDIILLIFIILVCISTYFSVKPKLSLIGASNRYEGLFTFLCYFLVYYCTKYYFDFNQKTLNLSLIVILITSILSILQYYNVPIISDIFRSQYYRKSFAAATFGNRNFFGSFVSISLPYIMCLYIFNNKKVYLLTASLNFFSLLACLTRSAWGSFFLFSFIGIIYIFSQKNKDFFKRTGILLSSFILVFLIFIFFDTDSIFSKLNTTVTDISSVIESQSLPDQTSNEYTNTENTQIIINNKKTERVASGRTLIWDAAFRLISYSPIIGVGPDAFLKALYIYDSEYLLKELYPKMNSLPDKAHNEYLQIASTIGIPALLVYLFFIIVTIIYLLKSNLKQNKTAFIILLCLISYLIQAFFNISTIGVAPIFYFLLGYTYQSRKSDTLEEN